MVIIKTIICGHNFAVITCLNDLIVIKIICFYLLHRFAKIEILSHVSCCKYEHAAATVLAYIVLFFFHQQYM